MLLATDGTAEIIGEGAAGAFSGLSGAFSGLSGAFFFEAAVPAAWLGEKRHELYQ